MAEKWQCQDMVQKITILGGFMRVGTLVKSKWATNIIGILLEKLTLGDDVEWEEECWKVYWIGNGAIFDQTHEEEEDLELL